MLKRYSFAILAFSFLLIAIFACGPYGLAYEKELVGKYVVSAVDIEDQAGLIKKTSSDHSNYIISPMVFAYGWNNDFIIAKQHPFPADGGFADITTTNWFIVVVASEAVYGPLTEQKYIELRQKLGVPDTLIFTESIDPTYKSETPVGKPK